MTHHVKWLAMVCRVFQAPWILVLLLLLAACPAFASTGPGVDSGIPDLGSISGISTGSAMRQIQANIEDWKDERTKSIPLRDSECREESWLRDVFSSSFVASPVLSVTDPETFVRGGFGIVSLTSLEKIELQNLTEMSDPSDPLDFEIGVRQLAIRVSNRIYSGAIETYRARAKAAESVNSLFGVADRCNEYTLKVLRDDTMIAESQKVLSLYGQQIQP